MSEQERFAEIRDEIVRLCGKEPVHRGGEWMIGKTGDYASLRGKIADLVYDQLEELDRLYPGGVVKEREDALAQLQRENEALRGKLLDEEHGTIALRRENEELHANLEDASLELGQWQAWALTQCDPPPECGDAKLREMMDERLAAAERRADEYERRIDAAYAELGNAGHIDEVARAMRLRAESAERRAAEAEQHMREYGEVCDAVAALPWSELPNGTRVVADAALRDALAGTGVAIAELRRRAAEAEAKVERVRELSRDRTSTRFWFELDAALSEPAKREGEV